VVQWSEQSEDKIARAQLRQLVSSFQSIAKARGAVSKHFSNLFSQANSLIYQQLLDFEFMNDASYTQSPLKSYGEESFTSLKAASEKWDPQAVFQKLQNSGFLLSLA